MKSLARSTAVIALAAASALALAACAPTATAAGGSATPGGGIAPIGYSAIFLQDPAQAAQVAAFEKDTQQRGLATLPPKSADGNSTTQDNDIRTLVTAGARSIILTPSDPSALVPAVNAARQQGVLVATILQGTTGGKVDISMAVDNYEIGVTACKYLAEKVGPHGTLLHVQGDLRTTVGQLRDQGFKDCLAQNYPGITAIAKTGGQWDPVTAAASVSAVLVSNPELGGIFMASEGYVDSVAQTLTSAGKTAPAGQNGHIWTIAVDGTPSGLDAIRHGKLDATLTQPLTDLITYALDDLQTIANGGSIPLGPTDHNSKVVETADGYPEDVFPSTLITTDNVDDPSNWGNNV